MREIKFRAWDKEKNKMVYFDLLSLVGSEDGVMIENNIYSNIDNPKYTFMQYTGLNDKNGKEIYEGDIVKSISDLPAYIKFGEYSAGGADYYASKAYGFYVQRIDEGKEYKDETETLGSYHEVLGNIYENPELLTN